MVIVPVHNGKSDAETDAAAQTLRSSLSAAQGLYVVDKNKVDSVLRYYERDGGGRTDVTKMLAQAKDNYYRLNYIEGKSLANKAISILKSDPQSVYDNGSDLVDAYLTLGIISRSMGNIGEARQAFREALRLDPKHKLDSRAFPPSMVNLFENVRESMNTQPKGGIKVVSDPKVADVFVNGVMVGVTPLTLEDLPEGVHYIKLSANKYTTVRKQINVTGGKNVKLKEELSWTGGKVGELKGKNYVGGGEDLTQIDDALKIANLLKVDKVVSVDVEGVAGGSGIVTARMVDAKYRAGQKPVSMAFGEGKSDINGALISLSKELVSQTHVNIAADPEKNVTPPGTGDPVLMGNKKQSRISKPVLFGVLGGVLAAGLGAGLAVLLSGGGSGGNNGTGSVNVNFTNAR